MKSLSEILRVSSAFLEEKGVAPSKRLAEDLIASALGLKRLDLFMPLAYIAGEVDFYGCKIRVDRRVLIPRHETEILVDQIAKRVEKGRLWDLCTGSGCIGIALKKARPQLEVVLADLSAEALEVAKRNAAGNGVQVEICQGDLLTPFLGQTADCVVCTPPYIDSRE